jgi:putative phosphoesterase
VIAVIADTHMPKGARRLPARCVELLRGADAVLHAGDFIRVEVLRELESICPGRVHAVHGNVDEAELRGLLPETVEVSLGAHRVAMIHDAGPAKGRLARMRRRFPEADAVVFGHSHLPLHEVGEGGSGREGGTGDFQIFNPGSPTERRRAPRRSMGLLDASGEALRFEHVWFD